MAMYGILALQDISELIRNARGGRETEPLEA